MGIFNTKIMGLQVSLNKVVTLLENVSSNGIQENLKVSDIDIGKDKNEDNNLVVTPPCKT